MADILEKYGADFVKTMTKRAYLAVADTVAAENFSRAEELRRKAFALAGARLGNLPCLTATTTLLDYLSSQPVITTPVSAETGEITPALSPSTQPEGEPYPGEGGGGGGGGGGGLPPPYELPQITEAAEKERIMLRPQKIENYVRAYYGMRGLLGQRGASPETPMKAPSQEDGDEELCVKFRPYYSEEEMEECRANMAREVQRKAQERAAEAQRAYKETQKALIVDVLTKKPPSPDAEELAAQPMFMRPLLYREPAPALPLRPPSPYHRLKGMISLGQPPVQAGTGAPVAAAKKIAEYIADAEMSGMTLYDAFERFVIETAPGFVKNTWPVNEAEIAGALAIFEAEYAGKPG